jgi:hypothetical protein
VVNITDSKEEADSGQSFNLQTACVHRTPMKTPKIERKITIFLPRLSANIPYGTAKIKAIKGQNKANNNADNASSAIKAGNIPHPVAVQTPSAMLGLTPTRFEPVQICNCHLKHLEFLVHGVNDQHSGK